MKTKQKTNLSTIKNKRKLEENMISKAYKSLDNKGITLIALVVTIVVLLILAGVSINLVLGDNGIISKAKETRDKYAQAESNDQAMIGEAGDWLLEALGEIPVGKATVNEKTDKNSTINGQTPSANNPIIPKGYIPIDTDTSYWGDGTKAPTQNDVDHGLVITDSVDESRNSNGNEWVWIPVPDVSEMYEKASGENAEGYSLCGTTDEDNIKTKIYSKSAITNDGGDKWPNERTTPGSIEEPYCREPDLLIGKDGTEYDAIDTNRAAAGFVNKDGSTMTVKEMAEAMVTNYDEMITSIEKYKGFYVGRYELSEAGEKKNQPTLTNTNWYDLYKKCTTLKVNDKVKTEMIWGCQWDVICNWIADKGEQKNIVDSSSWGNYKDYNTANGYENGNQKYEVGAGSKQNTGSSENWKANNIYDMAGNWYEWTQEAEYHCYRNIRGGASYENGVYYPVTTRNCIYADNDSNARDQRI